MCPGRPAGYIVATEEMAMSEYNLLMAGPAEPPRAISFDAHTPAQAFTLAQRHAGPAHLFEEGSYLCTLEYPGDFWIIKGDPVAAGAALKRAGRSCTKDPGSIAPAPMPVARHYPGRSSRLS
jgi:hypothetical protein